MPGPSRPSLRPAGSYRSSPTDPEPADTAAGAIRTTVKPPSSWLLTVDWTACDGRGWCAELLPEVIAQDRWGYPIPREDADRAAAAARTAAHEVTRATARATARDAARGTDRAAARRTREIPVPAPLTGHARRAADTCPRQALRLRHLP